MSPTADRAEAAGSTPVPVPPDTDGVVTDGTTTGDGAGEDEARDVVVHDDPVRSDDDLTVTGFSRRQGARLVRRVRRRLFVALAVANLAGATVVIACITVVLPGDLGTGSTRLMVANTALGAAFLLIVIPVAVLWGEAWLRSSRQWLQQGRAPTEREVTAVLRAPVRLFLIHATCWLIAAVLFSTVNGIVSVDLLARVAFTVTLGGLTTSAIAYLQAERISRPLAKVALSIRVVERPRMPGVVTRTMLAWILGTGVPLAGLAITALFALTERDATPTELAVTMLVLSCTGLVIGWWVTVLGARAVADPVSDLGRGIGQVAGGDLDARVEVFDGSVLGLLQAGFNDMAAGLQERERLRDLYGRQVGEDVAAAAMTKGSQLGGEVRTVAVLFVDVVGSTRIASDRPPEEVVDLLNRFFGVVVDEVHAHGGWINKFQGDATLAVFGAPAEMDDPAGCALAAARAIATRLPTDVAELSAGIGVAHGDAVAGNIGDERRFEFTVIGDPVNEAARLTELAKSYDPMVLASADAVAAAGPDERRRWEPCGTAELRGRTRATDLARPVAART